jgi:hypothetical protein
MYNCKLKQQAKITLIFIFKQVRHVRWVRWVGQHFLSKCTFIRQHFTIALREICVALLLHAQSYKMSDNSSYSAFKKIKLFNLLRKKKKDFVSNEVMMLID